MHSLLRPRASAVTSAASVAVVIYFLSDLTGASRVLTTVLAALAAYLAYNAAATRLDVET